MISRISIFILTLICFQNVYAQEEVDFGIVVWSENRDLTWEDFKGAPLADTADVYYADIYWESSNSYLGYAYHSQVPRTYMYCYTSYADSSIRTDELLRYLNVYFDLASYYAHELNYRSYKWRESSPKPVSFEAMKQALIQEWTLESQRLTIETDQGFQLDALERWENEMAVKLRDVPKILHKQGDYRFTFDLGIGGLRGIGDYDQYLTRTVAGVLALEFEKSNYVFGFGISGGGQRVKESFRQGTEVYDEGTEPHILNAFIHGGYNLFDNNRIRLVPRVGLGINNINYPEDEGIPSSNTVLDFTAALTADIKLKTDQSDLLSGQSLSDISLRLGAYYYPMKIGGANISHLIFTAGFSLSLGYVDSYYD